MTGRLEAAMSITWARARLVLKQHRRTFRVDALERCEEIAMLLGPA